MIAYGDDYSKKKYIVPSVSIIVIYTKEKRWVYMYLGLIWPLICCHHFMEYRFCMHSDVHGFCPYIKLVWTLAKHSLQAVESNNNNAKFVLPEQTVLHYHYFKLLLFNCCRF